MKKIITIICIVLFLAGAGGAVYLYLLSRSGLPDYDRHLKMPGLSRPVTVYRDQHAVPHIYAANKTDLYLATGYCMAQDRMWQMDLLRRVTTGRLSEIFGEKMVKADILFRSLRITDKSRDILQTLSPELKNYITAFSQGINRYLAEHEDDLPFEFKILGYTPDPWQPVHSANLIGYMAWDLAAGWDIEIVLHRLREKVGEKLVNELAPVLDNHGVTYPDDGTTALLDNLHERLSAAQTAMRKTGGPIFNASNNWAVSGAKSRTGSPLLENDMHLGLNAPGIWMQMHQVIEGELNVTGVALPGAPFVISGHNRDIAWGMTNVMVDNLDFYMEKINPENPDQYFFKGKPRPIATRKETIQIKGGESQVHEIRFTHHGPLVSELKGIGETAVSMRWLGNDDSNELLGVYLLNTAANWEQFKKALENFVAVSQNVVYADREGNIGLFCAAGIPIRPGNRGDIVFPGWTGEHEWQGSVPFSELPFTFNPAKGYVASANYKIADNFPYYISKWTFCRPDRLERINELLESKEKFSVADFQRMQTDTVSKLPQPLVDGIVTAVTADGELTGPAKEAVDALREWDFSMDAQSPAAAVFETFYLAFVQNTFADQMGPDLYKKYIKNKSAVKYAVEQIWQTESGWFDDTDTREQETFSDIVRKSFADAVGFLTETFGSDAAAWKWGDLHQLTLKHPMGDVKILDMLFGLNEGPHPVGGSTHTIPQLSYNYTDPYRIVHGPSQRHVYDLSDWDKSLSVIPTGNSGIPASRHYCDQTRLYIEGKLHPDYVSRPKIEGSAVYKMVLE